MGFKRIAFGGNFYADIPEIVLISQFAAFQIRNAFADHIAAAGEFYLRQGPAQARVRLHTENGSGGRIIEYFPAYDVSLRGMNAGKASYHGFGHAMGNGTPFYAAAECKV